MKFFEEPRKTSEQQTKFRHVKFHMNHPKSFKKCSVTYKILQNFPVLQPGIIQVNLRGFAKTDNFGMSHYMASHGSWAGDSAIYMAILWYTEIIDCHFFKSKINNFYF